MPADFETYREAFWAECVRDLEEQQELLSETVRERIRSVGSGGRNALRALYLYAWLYAPDSDFSEALDLAGRNLFFVAGGMPDVLMKAVRPAGGGRQWYALFYGTDGDDIASHLETFAEACVAADESILPPGFLRAAATWHDANPLGGGLHVLVASDELLPATDFARVSAGLDRLSGVAGKYLSSEVFSLRHAYASQRDDRVPVSVPLAFRSATVSEDGQVVVGSVALADLYGFMAAFERRAQSIHLLYEENIRFEKPGSRVNAGILETLRSEPDSFGLYSGGITVVVEGLGWDGENRLAALVSPQVVNGCQTSRTVYRFVREECVYGGRDYGILGDGFVPVKVVAVTSDGTPEAEERRRAEVREITRYANTQNRVREVDLLRHDPRMKEIKAYLASRGTHLELQGGSWAAAADDDAAGDRLTPDDLLRGLGSVFLASPGNAYGRLDKLMPGGSEPRLEDVVRIMGDYDLTDTGAEDCYEYLLSLDSACVLAVLSLRSRQREAYDADSLAESPARKGSQYLFYHAVARLLVAELGTPRSPISPRDLADYINEPANGAAIAMACDRALAVLDAYLDESSGGFRREPLFRDKATDRNRFLKAPELADPECCPYLASMLDPGRYPLPATTEHLAPADGSARIANDTVGDRLLTALLVEIIAARDGDIPALEAFTLLNALEPFGGRLSEADFRTALWSLHGLDLLGGPELGSLTIRQRSVS